MKQPAETIDVETRPHIEIFGWIKDKSKSLRDQKKLLQKLKKEWACTPTQFSLKMGGEQRISVQEYNQAKKLLLT